MTTFKLEYPITAPDGTVITELQLRRLKGKEMKTVDVQPSDGKMGAALKYVALMNNLPPSVLDEIDGADMLDLIGEAAPFLVRGIGAMQSS
ncbi:phage tail assembly protein [Rhodocyclus purpureus]|uniref:phage tail assembly protein n=1 Tax=Rhodocyclus purpureus TaxID=1067 RepID=UPI0019136DDF|nr:phage tail assembly protein [Rhodocyclus purpureus]MBK5915150.1 hypothetical protein [Rhodocyclus purpureus]